MPDRRAEIVAFVDQAYDQDNDGWGKNKLVDGPTLTYALERARSGDKEMEGRVRRTLVVEVSEAVPEGLATVPATPDEPVGPAHVDLEKVGVERRALQVA